ncbi:class I glutamine amidotransferase-like protein [Microdochium trichocladiopsis]|uniref:Class I glutamine amidotransferase-like protein n=1 Tax=Microdochium trichocladiopsis TaxID=1682393 RepID=A0A9P8YIR2_9PEZI|nr:class I glutamine amidotransferase-like protein [Microdochium trichocladiopsis]KAH7040081.1 class I glutamine amidotransferase-like protein [Microdochium trichocladiopsis]
MSSPIDLKNPDRVIHVGVILLESITEILDVAPLDLFSGLSKRFVMDIPEAFLPQCHKDEALDIEFHWVSASGGAMELTAGVKLQTTNTFEDCPPLDVALMGAHEVGIYQLTEAELAFIRKTYEHCAAFLCICAGMMPALQAGLLQGKTVTAPREMLPELRKQAPDVDWVSKRWANDGKVWTSGALLNGLDMMVAFAQHTWGNKAADGKPLELIAHMIKMGGWPVRDVDYKDECF